MIHPITSEAICVVTRNDVLEEVLPAGTEVPSTDINATDFIIDRDQPHVELPFCVGGRDKVIGNVKVMCPDPQGSFKAGTPVRVSCSITHDKLNGTASIYKDGEVLATTTGEAWKEATIATSDSSKA